MDYLKEINGFMESYEKRNVITQINENKPSIF